MTSLHGILLLSLILKSCENGCAELEFVGFGMSSHVSISLAVVEFFTNLLLFVSTQHEKMEPVEEPLQIAESDAPMKIEETVDDGKSMSEDDLLKLRKINFKKKVSGEKLWEFLKLYK